MNNAIDLHIHTQASDGSDSPEQIIQKIRSAGITVFSITDHDTIDAAVQIEKLIPPQIRYLRGIEFSCCTPKGKCHILGYNYDPMDPVFLSALEYGRDLRREKLEQRLTFLRDKFQINLTDEEKRWIYCQKSPGKPHIASILVQRGLAPDHTAAIRQYINPFRGSSDRIPAETAIHAILHAGGIPVWAHPLGGEGERRLEADAFYELLRELICHGIMGLECFYSRYNKAESDFLLKTANVNDLLISAGSDYHGSNKVGIELGMLNSGHEAIDPAKVTLLHHL